MSRYENTSKIYKDHSDWKEFFDGIEWKEELQGRKSALLHALESKLRDPQTLISGSPEELVQLHQKIALEIENCFWELMITREIEPKWEELNDNVASVDAKEGSANWVMVTQEYLDSLHPTSHFYKRLLDNIKSLWTSNSRITQEDLYLNKDNNLVIGWWVMREDIAQKQLSAIQKVTWRPHFQYFLSFSKFVAKLCNNVNPFVNLYNALEGNDQWMVLLQDNIVFLKIMASILPETVSFPLKFSKRYTNPTVCTLAKRQVRVFISNTPFVRTCPTVYYNGEKGDATKSLVL